MFAARSKVEGIGLLRPRVERELRRRLEESSSASGQTRSNGWNSLSHSSCANRSVMPAM